MTRIVLVSGWPDGYAFILSFLAPLWAIGNFIVFKPSFIDSGCDFHLGAFDSTVHISEEATNADVAIPYAIILAATSSGVLGWGMPLVFCFISSTLSSLSY